MVEAMMIKMMRMLVFYQLLSNWDPQFGRTRMIMYLCIYDIFGPENPCLPAFGYRSMRCLGLHTQFFSKWQTNFRTALFQTSNDTKMSHK